MVSVMSALRYIKPASRYHPLYQSRSLMYIRGLIPRNFTESAEAVPIGLIICKNHEMLVDMYAKAVLHYRATNELTDRWTESSKPIVPKPIFDQKRTNNTVTRILA